MVPVQADDADCSYSSVLSNDSDQPSSFWHRPSSCELEQQANEFDREGKCPLLNATQLYLIMFVTHTRRWSLVSQS